MVVPAPDRRSRGRRRRAGLSKLTSAFDQAATGAVVTVPGGLLRKSTRSLPAQNESPAPCQSTTRYRLVLRGGVEQSSARVSYIAEVIGVLLSPARFSWTRKMLPERSGNDVTHLPPPVAVDSNSKRAGIVHARAKTVDIVSGETKLFQNLVVMLADSRRAPGRYFRNTVHLNQDC